MDKVTRVQCTLGRAVPQLSPAYVPNVLEPPASTSSTKILHTKLSLTSASLSQNHSAQNVLQLVCLPISDKSLSSPQLSLKLSLQHLCSVFPLYIIPDKRSHSMPRSSLQHVDSMHQRAFPFCSEFIGNSSTPGLKSSRITRRRITMESVQAKVQDAINNLITTIDKDHLRKMQVNSSHL